MRWVPCRWATNQELSYQSGMNFALECIALHELCQIIHNCARHLLPFTVTVYSCTPCYVALTGRSNMTRSLLPGLDCYVHLVCGAYVRTCWPVRWCWQWPQPAAGTSVWLRWPPQTHASGSLGCHLAPVRGEGEPNYKDVEQVLNKLRYMSLKMACVCGTTSVVAPNLPDKRSSGRPLELWKYQCTVFQQPRCIQSQHSSEEAYHIFGRKLLVFGRSILVCSEAASQMHAAA